MKIPKDIKLVEAKYHSDYKYHFVFSNGKESVVDFKPIILHGISLRKFLDITIFKKMKIDNNFGDIYWGKDWDMCFHIESIYGRKEIRPINMKKGVKILNARYVNDYKIKFKFSDGHINIFDYESLVTSKHKEFKKYLNIIEFKKFSIIKNNTGLAWGDNWEMILPLDTLYKNKK